MRGGFRHTVSSQNRQNRILTAEAVIEGPSPTRGKPVIIDNKE
jgi:hypothetical protein